MVLTHVDLIEKLLKYNRTNILHISTIVLLTIGIPSAANDRPKEKDKLVVEDLDA